MSVLCVWKFSAAAEVGHGVSGASVSAVGGTREIRACVHCGLVCMSVSHHWCHQAGLANE